MRLPLFEDLARELARVQAERPKDFDPSTLSAEQLAQLAMVLALLFVGACMAMARTFGGA